MLGRSRPLAGQYHEVHWAGHHTGYYGMCVTAITCDKVQVVVMYCVIPVGWTHSVCYSRGLLLRAQYNVVALGALSLLLVVRGVVVLGYVGIRCILLYPRARVVAFRTPNGPFLGPVPAPICR